MSNVAMQDPGYIIVHDSFNDFLNEISKLPETEQRARFQAYLHQERLEVEERSRRRVAALWDR